jgi:iron complex transport system ATP-binding protein
VSSSPASTIDPILEIQDVTAWRGDTRVFDGLTLAVERGSHAAILGPNGAGKSTLLKLLSREIYPERREGSFLRIFGRERWNVWELRSHLGIVSHDMQPRFPKSATGRDVILSGFHSSLGVWAHHRFSQDDRKRAEQVMGRLGIEELAGRRYTAMSTGERGRFLLGRALVHEPEVLVLDEPTSGLDPRACFEYIDTMRALIRGGTTVLLVTHHIHEIPPEVERVILLREGRVVGDAPKRELLTSARLTELFGTPMRVLEEEGFFQVVPAGRGGKGSAGKCHDGNNGTGFAGPEGGR